MALHPAVSDAVLAPWPGSARRTLDGASTSAQWGRLSPRPDGRSSDPRANPPALLPRADAATGLDARDGSPAGRFGPRRARVVPVDAGVLRRHVRGRDRSGGRGRADPQCRPDDGRADPGRADRGQDDGRTAGAVALGLDGEPGLGRRSRDRPRPAGCRRPGSRARAAGGRPDRRGAGRRAGAASAGASRSARSSAGRSPQSCWASRLTPFSTCFPRCSGSGTSSVWSQGDGVRPVRGGARVPRRAARVRRRPTRIRCRRRRAGRPAWPPSRCWRSTAAGSLLSITPGPRSARPYSPRQPPEFRPQPSKRPKGREPRSDTHG